MMYVRTKDGVYEVEQSQLEDDEEVVNCDYGQIHKLEILRKSENLAELCDCFVIALKDSYKNPNDNMYDKEEYYSLFQRIGYAENYYNEDYNDLYGAIWTDKGLIYVAKMNEKGTLELL